MATEEPPSFDEQFEQAVGEWRDRHDLSEDDAVILLLELFRIHQQHWDALRRREFPSLEGCQDDIRKLSEAARQFQQQAVQLVEQLQKKPETQGPSGVSHVTAFIAAIAAGLVGFFIGTACH